MADEPAANTREQDEFKKQDYGEKDTIFVCLDGTLSDFRHRLDLRINDYNWDTFHEASEKDPLNVDIALIIRMLAVDFFFIVYTTRPEKYRAMTVAWLKKYQIHPDVLLMKQHRHNYAKDEAVKVTLVKEEFATQSFPAGDDEKGNIAVVAVFENDKKASEALRNKGYTVFNGA